MLGLTKQTPTGLRVFDACRYIIYLTKKGSRQLQMGII